jgi:hypothetical protein
MDWKSNHGKSRLIRVLHTVGISFRKGERGVNAVFDILADGLRRGEPVDIPGGTIRCRTVQCKRRAEFTRLNNIHTGCSWYKFLSFRGGPHRRISFRPDPNLDLTPPPAPPPAPPAPPPPTQAEIDIVETVTRLMGKRPDSSLIRRLSYVIENALGPHRPDSLLKRLRGLEQRGRRYTSSLMLEWDLPELYWL